MLLTNLLCNHRNQMFSSREAFQTNLVYPREDWSTSRGVNAHVNSACGFMFRSLTDVYLIGTKYIFKELRSWQCLKAGDLLITCSVLQLRLIKTCIWIKKWQKNIWWIKSLWHFKDEKIKKLNGITIRSCIDIQRESFWCMF